MTRDPLEKYRAEIRRKRIDLRANDPPDERETAKIFSAVIRSRFPDRRYAYGLGWTPDQYVDFYSALVDRDTIFSMKVVDPLHPYGDESNEEQVSSVNNYRKAIKGRRIKDFELILSVLIADENEAEPG